MQCQATTLVTTVVGLGDESEMTSSQTYGSVLFSSCCLRCRRSESQEEVGSVLPEPARSNCAVQRFIRRRGKASRIWHDFTFLTVKTRLLAVLLAPSLARSGISHNIIIVIISCFVRHRFGDRSNPDTNPLTNLPIFLCRVHMRTCGAPCPGPACASHRLVLVIPAQAERAPRFLPPLPNKANTIAVRLQNAVRQKQFFQLAGVCRPQLLYHFLTRPWDHVLGRVDGDAQIPEENNGMEGCETNQQKQ